VSDEITGRQSRRTEPKPRIGRPVTLRWLKFNAVGALGIGVQLAALLVLKSALHLNYLPATALAVEVAVFHNFLWHERYTWADRVQPSWRHSLPRLLHFNLTTGGVSTVGNLALMKLLAGSCRINYLAADAIAITMCSLVNFLVSDACVFRQRRLISIMTHDSSTTFHSQRHKLVKL
jgi:putative flippase GtrA